MQLVIKFFGKDCKVGSAVAGLNFNTGTYDANFYTFARHFVLSDSATVPVAVEPGGGQNPKAMRRLCHRPTRI